MSDAIASMARIKAPDTDTVRIVEKDLRYTNPDYVRQIRFGSYYGNLPPKHKLGYIKDGADYLVPRSWYLRTLARQFSVATSEIKAELPVPLLSPLPHQLAALNELISLVDRNDSAGLPTDTYIVLPPGEGKSILGMLAIACCRQKALVVVPTREIEETWMRDAKKCFGTTDFIGIIRGQRIDTDKPVSIGSIQTLMDLDPKLWGSHFGMCLMDELHRLGAEKFANVAKNCAATIRVGMTATDFRRDGRFISVRWHLGDPCYKSDERTNSVPLEYHAVITSFGVSKTPTDEIDFNTLLAALQNNHNRNEAIVWLAQHILSTDTGDVLIVSPRVEHLNSIGVLLAREGISHTVVTGTTKNRKQVFEQICRGDFKVTIATTSLMSEGASNPRWHHVINTLPFSDPKTAIQLSGRCIRKREGKTCGKFWDIVDANPMCKAMYATRWKALKRVLKSSAAYSISSSPPFTLTLRGTK